MAPPEVTMIPPNVVRPTPESWGASWGDRPIPEGYGGRAIELATILSLERLGANLTILPAGLAGCPLHYHHFEEEVFFVLSGELSVREQWPDAAADTVYSLRAGELVVYPPGTAIAHQFRNLSDADVRILALSDAWHPGEVGVYPDSGKIQVRGLGRIGVFDGDGSPGDRVARAAEQAASRGAEALSLDQRPAWVSGLDRVPEVDLGTGVFGRPLARRAGATSVFANLDRLTPGAVSSPLHWHTSDEELVVVISGHPILRQVRRDVEERVALAPGDVVAFRGGDRIAHQVLGPEGGEASILVVGTHRADDVTVFPETGQICVRALERTGILATTGYWDGEDGAPRG